MTTQPRRMPRPSAVVHRAREALWRLGPSYEPRTELSFPLDRDTLADLTIEWPDRYRWPPSEGWLNPLREGLGLHVRVVPRSLSEPATAVVVFVATLDGERHEIAVDYSDYEETDEEWVERASLYFKMQFDPSLHGGRGIMPGGYIPYSSSIYTLLPALRRRSATARRRTLYGRFSLNNDVRLQADAALKAQMAFAYDAGAASTRYSAYLAGAAGSAVCLDLPGRGPFCFRLVDYLAAGCCIVALRHAGVLPVPLVDGEHIAYADSVDELVDRCRQVLDDVELRDTLAAGARDYFDRYLERRQLAAYYLSEIFRVAG